MFRVDKDYFNQLKHNPFNEKFQNIKLALIDYLDWLERCPQMQLDPETKLKKIVWDSAKDEDDALYIIIKLGRLLAHLRAVVPTWDTSGHQGTDYAYATPMKEEPDRAMEVLRNIARGVALSKGRNYMTKEDLPLAIKVALSTASIERVNIFDLLIAHKGTLTTSIITESLNNSPHTAHRIMTELKAVGLVDMKKSDTQSEEKQITLRNEFDWFLEDDFRKLREGFIPTDNTEEMKTKDSLEEKNPLITCYQCKKVNHGTPVYQTHSFSDYKRHWITSGHKGPCQPSLIDCEHHGWEPQGLYWESW